MFEANQDSTHVQQVEDTPGAESKSIPEVTQQISDASQKAIQEFPDQATDVLYLEQNEKSELSDVLESSEDIENDLDRKIYCANCVHCILMKFPTGLSGEYVLRVKCASKKWKKKLGEEKIYKFFTVARRTVDQCDLYEPMGDLRSYLKDLRKSLPIKDEVYKSSL